METLELALKNAIADIIGAIGIASATIGILMTIGLWVAYWWNNHHAAQETHRNRKH